MGGGEGGRGALLNGKLDYDNADNVARFLLAADLGQPDYDPRTVSRALRLTRADQGEAEEAPGMAPATHISHNGHVPADPVYLMASARDEALAWRDDRAKVYNYLHEGHRNLALHAMLRKSVDLAAEADQLPPDFFDLTDGQALAVLRSALGTPAALIADRAAAVSCYACVWEALVPTANAAEIPFRLVRERLELERRLAVRSRACRARSRPGVAHLVRRAPPASTGAAQPPRLVGFAPRSGVAALRDPSFRCATGRA